MGTTRIQILSLVAGGLQTAFWIYTFVVIGRTANPMGDGMELVALVPMTMIWACLTLPATVLSIWRRSVPLALLLHLVAIAAFGWIWSEISAELARPRTAGPRTLVMDRPGPVAEGRRHVGRMFRARGADAGAGVAREPSGGDDISCA
ncbi:hypothetical protein GCM10010994_19120 [Chelatococcus reniformis]|uniref:Uncharacterized protein n=2 Tax=Chelatococcus reniformis TaxID=1494448 RepID=A0A916U673_9HYPH|nr:hypothetical protein GCM10010994_19120 [Chelatococcus reniformis]